MRSDLKRFKNVKISTTSYVVNEMDNNELETLLNENSV